MELRHLRYFVAVADEEHVGRAARRLRISQPPLSRQVRELERELGCELFLRSGRGLRLSPAGRAFLEGARATLAAADAAVLAAARTARGEGRTIHIGFVESTIYGGFLVELVRRFRSAHRGTAILLQPSSSSEVCDAVGRGRVQLGFVYHAPPPGLGLASRRVWSEELVLAVPRGHPLARRRSVRSSDLAGEPFVWLPRAIGPIFHDEVLAACRARGLDPVVAQEAAADDVRLLLVAGGVGYTFTIASSRRTKPAGVVLKRVSDLGVRLTVHVVWREDDERDPPVDTLLELVEGLVSPARHDEQIRPA